MNFAVPKFMGSEGRLLFRFTAAMERCIAARMIIRLKEYGDENVSLNMQYFPPVASDLRFQHTGDERSGGTRQVSRLTSFSIRVQDSQP